jgi:hypothetical protein
MSKNLWLSISKRFRSKGLPLVYMVYRVVSTKLNEDEHMKLLDACNRHGCTPSALIREAIT